MGKEKVTFIKITVAVRGTWDKVSVNGLIDDFRTECLSKPEFLSIWQSETETKEVEVISRQRSYQE